jgi:hypothetical protein
MKDLYQEGEFASEQLVTIVGPRQRIIPNVRILGPVRNYTQVELSYLIPHSLPRVGTLVTRGIKPRARAKIENSQSSRRAMRWLQ